LLFSGAISLFVPNGYLLFNFAGTIGISSSQNWIRQTGKK
jgi:hypothetical protein